ncbi:hypothetical protein BDZ97DRAFT_1820149, partial [Flammula alnicola]
MRFWTSLSIRLLRLLRSLVSCHVSNLLGDVKLLVRADEDYFTGRPGLSFTWRFLRAHVWALRNAKSAFDGEAAT